MQKDDIIEESNTFHNFLVIIVKKKLGKYFKYYIKQDSAIRTLSFTSNWRFVV